MTASDKEGWEKLRADNLALQAKVERRIDRLKKELHSCFELLSQTAENSQRDALYFADVVENDTGRRVAVGNAYQLSHSPSIASTRHTPDPFASGFLAVVKTKLSRCGQQVSPSPTLASDVVLLAAPLNADEQALCNVSNTFPLQQGIQWSPSVDNIFVGVLRAVAKRLVASNTSLGNTGADLLCLVCHFTFRHWRIAAVAMEHLIDQWRVPTIETFNQMKQCLESPEDVVDMSWDREAPNYFRYEWGRVATLSATCCYHRWAVSIQPALELTRLLSTEAPSSADTGAVLGQMAQLLHSWEGLNWAPQEDAVIMGALRDRSGFVTSRCVWKRIAIKLGRKGLGALRQSNCVKGISKHSCGEAPRYKSEFHALHESLKIKHTNHSVGHSVFAVVSRFQRLLNPFHCGASTESPELRSKILNDILVSRSTEQDSANEEWSLVSSPEEDERIFWALNNAMSLGRPAHADDVWLQFTLSSLALCEEDVYSSVLPLHSKRCHLRSEAFVEGRLRDILSKRAETYTPLEHGCLAPLSRRPISGPLFATPPSPALRSVEMPRRLLEQFSDEVMFLLMVMSRKVVEKLPLTVANGKDVTSFLQHFVMEGKVSHARVSLHSVKQRLPVTDLLRACSFFMPSSLGTLSHGKLGPKRPRDENCVLRFEWREDVNAILLYFVELYQKAYGPEFNMVPVSSRSLTEVKRLWHNVARCVSDYWQDSCDDASNTRVSPNECISQWKLLKDRGNVVRN